jgi:hypothetical protein
VGRSCVLAKLDIERSVLSAQTGPLGQSPVCGRKQAPSATVTRAGPGFSGVWPASRSCPSLSLAEAELAI